jgi:predicted nucleic acid-binding protein
VRVVIDSSVVVAALATPNPESASRVVLAAVAVGLVELVITDELEAEYRRAVEYPQVRRQAPRVNGQGFIDAIVATADRVEAAQRWARCLPTRETTWWWRPRSRVGRTSS